MPGSDGTGLLGGSAGTLPPTETQAPALQEEQRNGRGACPGVPPCWSEEREVGLWASPETRGRSHCRCQMRKYKVQNNAGSAPATGNPSALFPADRISSSGWPEQAALPRAGVQPRTQTPRRKGLLCPSRPAEPECEQEKQTESQSRNHRGSSCGHRPRGGAAGRGALAPRAPHHRQQAEGQFLLLFRGRRLKENPLDTKKPRGFPVSASVVSRALPSPSFCRETSSWVQPRRKGHENNAQKRAFSYV